MLGKFLDVSSYICCFPNVLYKIFQQRIMRLKNDEILLEMMAFGPFLDRTIHVYLIPNNLSLTSPQLSPSLSSQPTNNGVFIFNGIFDPLTSLVSIKVWTCSTTKEWIQNMVSFFFYMFKKKARWTVIILKIIP